ncbi:MAG: hypothetical protein J6W06_04835 [Bacteroidales bacterium]|jgi:hypothetical protein|nr:hypothetical protein [Bacteroidales bacterium]
MKKLLVLLTFVAICATAFSQSISHIENKNNFYHIYNEKNQDVKTVTNQIGTLVGHGSNFFIVKKFNFYDLYDMQGRKYKSISTSVGDIVSVSGETFVVRKGNFTSVYNSKGEKIK